MQKVKIFQFYAFGYNYCLLRNNASDWNKNELISELQNFIRTLEGLEAPVTLKIAGGLHSIIAKIRALNSDNVDKAIFDEIEKSIDRIDPALDAELEIKEAYILTEKRFSLKNLTISPQKLLAQNVFESLSENAKRDFSLACHQIALNQPTASAFHLMRALEGEVKKLYYHFKKTKRLKKPMWGPMIDQLRNKKNPKPSKNSLDHLDSIRINYRNPTQHPELFYTLDEAQDLLNQTITAINMIHNEIK